MVGQFSRVDHDDCLMRNVLTFLIHGQHLEKGDQKDICFSRSRLGLAEEVLSRWSGDDRNRPILNLAWKLKFAVIYPFLDVLSEQQISPLGEDHLTLSIFFPCEWLDEYLFFELDWLFLFFQPHQFKLPDLFLKTRWFFNAFSYKWSIYKISQMRYSSNIKILLILLLILPIIHCILWHFSPLFERWGDHFVDSPSFLPKGAEIVQFRKVEVDRLGLAREEEGWELHPGCNVRRKVFNQGFHKFLIFKGRRAELRWFFLVVILT